MNITNEELFSRSIQMLMKGQIICEFVDEDAYAFLSDQNHFLQADEFVRRLGKAIRKTHDGNAEKLFQIMYLKMVFLILILPVFHWQFSLG